MAGTIVLRVPSPVIATTGTVSQVARQSAHLDDELHRYLVDHGTQLDDLQRDLIDETAQVLPDAMGMQISPEQASFLTLLTKLVDVRYAVEVGTFTGYSALAIARGLADGGRLLTCDTSAEYTAVARKYWERAQVHDLIDLRLGPAAQTLRSLPDEQSIDLSFIDADKGGYIEYWDELVARTRLGGVIAVDNVLWGGRVLDTSPDASTKAIQAFNEHALRDQRVELTMLPVSDGLTLARRR